MVQLFPPSVVRTMVPYSPTTVPVFASTKEAPRRLLPCGRGFCQCHWELATGRVRPTRRLGASVAGLLEMVAGAPLRACPVWMASTSPKETARPRIVNGILGFVTLIDVLGLFVVVCVNLLTAVGGPSGASALTRRQRHFL